MFPPYNLKKGQRRSANGYKFGFAKLAVNGAAYKKCFSVPVTGMANPFLPIILLYFPK